MSGRRSNVHAKKGKAVFEILTVRERADIRGELATKTSTVAGDMTVSGNFTVLDHVVAAGDVMVPDVHRAALAQTVINQSVNISPLASLDPATVVISTNPAKGSLGAVNPSTGVAEYTPAAGFTGLDIYSYVQTSPADHSVPSMRSVEIPVTQYVNVFEADAPPYANRADLSGNEPLASSHAYPMAGYVVATADSVDVTSGVVVSAVWDPMGKVTASGVTVGPVDVSTVPEVDLSFNASGELVLAVTDADYRNAVLAFRGSHDIIKGTYKFSDSSAVDSNVAEFVIA